MAQILKPPLGCKPYWVAIPQRVEALATSIASRVQHGPLDGRGCVAIQFWAKEIETLCYTMVHLEEIRDQAKELEDN